MAVDWRYELDALESELDDVQRRTLARVLQAASSNAMRQCAEVAENMAAEAALMVRGMPYSRRKGELMAEMTTAQTIADIIKGRMG